MNTLKSDLEKLSLIVEGISAGIWDWHIKTGKEWWSPSFYDIIGYKQGEIEATYDSFIHQLLHPDDRPLVEKSVAEHLQTGKLYRLDIRILHKDGQYRWFETSGKASFDTKGKPLRMCGSVIDITEKKLLQLRLEEQSKLLEEVCAMTHSGGWEVDLRTQRSIWSKQVYQICQMPESYTPTLQDALALYTQESASRLGLCVDKAINEGTSWDEELQLVTGQKNTIWVRAIGKPVYAENGQIKGLQGVIQDITDRKLVDDTLQESETRWQFALEGNGDGLWDWNAQTNTVFFSPQWKRMLGYSDQEIGSSLDEWSKRVHPDDLEGCYADLQAHFRKETAYYINEHRVLCKDGIYKWILDRGKVITWDEQGRPLRVIGTHSDMTYRREAEELIKESEEKFHTLFVQAPIGIVLNDLSTGKFLEANPAFIKSTGYTEDEIKDLTFSQITPHEYAQKDAEQVALLNQAGRYGPFEKEYITNNGRLVPVLLNGMRVETKQGHALAWSFIQDISVRKAKEELIGALNEKLTISNAQKDKLMAMLSHDLKSPIASVDGLLWIILQEMGDRLPEDMVAMLSSIKSRISDISRLLDELLFWSLSQSDKLTFAKAEVNIWDAIDVTCRVLQTQADTKGVVLHNEVPSGLTINTDPQMLQIVLRNLMANALKFSYPQGVVSIQACLSGSRAEITVSDTGVGISQEKLQVLQNQGNVLSMPGTKGEKGTGFGLNLCLELARKQGGNLRMESELNQGSRFTLVLPLN